MPELPEVETITRGIKEQLLDSKVLSVEFLRDKLRTDIPVKKLERILKGNVVRKVWRRSKYILIQTDHGTCIIHLGMTGNLLTIETQNPIHKHTHVVIVFEKNQQKKFLHYVDPRRFGLFEYADNDILDTHPLLKNLGPEPLEYKGLAQHLFSRSRKKKTPIKTFIMDAKQVVGVGNIYASESLFDSGIHPLRSCSQLSLAEYVSLQKSIVKILKKAIKAGGTTLKDFKNSDGALGYFFVELNVYGKDSEACKRCGSSIEKVIIGGRSSFFCPNCQKLAIEV